MVDEAVNMRASPGGAVSKTRRRQSGPGVQAIQQSTEEPQAERLDLCRKKRSISVAASVGQADTAQALPGEDRESTVFPPGLLVDEVPVTHATTAETLHQTELQESSESPSPERGGVRQGMLSPPPGFFNKDEAAAPMLSPPPGVWAAPPPRPAKSHARRKEPSYSDSDYSYSPLPVRLAAAALPPPWTVPRSTLQSAAYEVVDLPQRAPQANVTASGQPPSTGDLQARLNALGKVLRQGKAK